MEHPIVVPRLGGAESYHVLAWLKEEGNLIKVGDPLLVVETDKAANELTAEVSGVLSKILVSAGQWVQAGTTLGHIA